MAKISSFREMALNCVEPSEKEPDSIRMFRRLLESEEVRLLLGDFFLRIAANEPQNQTHPHRDLFRRMVGDREFACNLQIMNLADNLDLLREYDTGIAKRQSLRKNPAPRIGMEESINSTRLYLKKNREKEDCLLESAISTDTSKE